MPRHASSIRVSRTGRAFSAIVIACSLCSFAMSGCLRDAAHPWPDTPALPPESTADLSVAVDWAAVRGVIYDRCVTCHAEPGPAADLNLTLATSAQRSALEGRLIARINDAVFPMPPSGLLPEETRELLGRWAAQGAPIESSAEPRTWLDLSADLERADLSTEGERMGSAASSVVPLAVGDRGIGFLERMNGHWVGSMELMGQAMPWFAFDYRPIGPSHVHGIFEGGTMGNLMTSFFLARYRGVDTLVARNGGVLNGIYRTSYFVLDRIEERSGSTEYRFVDAIGGAEIMWMTLVFTEDRLEWEAYTSRMGEQPEPSRHMLFSAKRKSVDLAERAAVEVGFPSDEPLLDLPDGFAAPDWGSYGRATSASYMWEDRGLDAERMGVLAGDPVRIEHLTHLSRLTVSVERTPAIADATLLVYLSREPFTDESGSLRASGGSIRENVFDTVLLFPEIRRTQNDLTFTYLHPGEYELTIVADLDRDGIPGSGDPVGPSRRLVIEPGTHPRVIVDDVPP